VSEYYNSSELGIELLPTTKKIWAAAFHVVAKGSFNGLWRERRDGGNNTPSRIADGDSMPLRWPVLDEYRNFLSGYEITCGDYKQVPTGGAESLLYIDPPYAGTFSNDN
jgi:site-specific DNA-adenine methylase